MPALQHAKDALIPRPGPQRLLSAVNLAYAVGRGVFLSGSVVYFTTVTGLSAGQVALGSSAAALSGFVASLLLGMLADRVGARRMLAVVFVLQAVGFALYPTVHSTTAFYALIVSIGFVEYGVGPSFGAFVSAVVEPEERVQVRAILRTMFNIGFSVGSGVAALALFGGGFFVRALPWASSVLWLGAALLVARLPRGRRSAAAGRNRRFGALRDLRFVGVTALSAPLALHASIILVVLPLWTVERTDAPHGLIPLLMIANTVFVIAFQVAASRGADTVAGAARLARRSGLWLAAACAVAAAATVGGAVTASVALGVAMLLLTVAELQQAASGWGLAHGLAPEEAQGEYLGTFHLHMILQSVLGPGVVAAATMSWGGWGWAAVAGAVLVCAAAVVPLARDAERHRPRPAESGPGSESEAGSGSDSAAPSTALAEAA
ncbi:MFS transporter [Streptomyces sp. NPDC005209]|uniref:MFS transporter n=1 Tax=Streptomyces sp. NPDC005209 TaxID=3156715 RepID=UPI0033AF52F0